jgi:uncharacterized membrane protein YeaQ/YmgE (transglycosylase-associated protein family)
MIILLVTMLVLGLIAGLIAHYVYNNFITKNPKKDSVTWTETLLVGVAGSYVGGFINFLLGASTNMVAPSSIGMSVLGAIIFLMVTEYWKAKRGIQ